MPENNQLTIETQSDSKTIRIGFADLSHDAEQIQGLLQNREAKGVLLNAWNGGVRSRCFYRPNEADGRIADITQTIRKFLAVTSVLGGRAELKVVENEKDIPKKAVDFEEYFKALREESRIFD